MSGPVSVRAPLRISLGGGGTDLPSHFRRHGGFAVSAAIDRHVRMRIAPSQTGRYRLSHLEREDCVEPGEVRHPILRAALERHADGPVELSSGSDVPPGTGLGSSGAYTVCAVKALELSGGRDLSPGELAEAASAIELGDLGRRVGKQDQYAAAHGGVNSFTFERDGTVAVRPLALPGSVREALSESFLLFFTGQSRSADEILAAQVSRAEAGDRELDANLIRTEEVARSSQAALESGDLGSMGDLMEDGWALKRARLPEAVTPRFEELRELALGAGARSAVLTGAGAGGYLLALATDPTRLRAAMATVDAPELGFGLDKQGCVAE